MSPSPLTRRQAMQLLATLGIGAPAAAELLAQEGTKQVSAATLADAGSLIDADLTPAQVEIVSKVIQKNIDQYEIFRRFEIDDRIEPAPVFLARGRP